MTSPNEYRDVFKFLLLQDIESAEIIQELREAYEEECLPRVKT